MGRVSVIVPVYNQESYLYKSLDSIINQSWNDLDIILVNDGSTDNSLRILYEYQEKDKRIRIINQNNEGLVGAVVSGIKNCNGEYICFVDPDDYIEKDFVYKFMSEIDDFDFVAMGYYVKDKQRIEKYELLENRVYSDADLAYCRGSFLKESNKPGLSNRFGVSRCNKLYRTELIRKILPTYEKCRGVALGEDSIFSFLLIYYANKCKTICEPNGYFYNISSSNSMTFHGEAEKYLEKIINTQKCFSGILMDFNQSLDQANFLCYLLGCNLINRLIEKKQIGEFCMAYRFLHKNQDFMDGFEMDIQFSFRDKTKRFLWKAIQQPVIYYYSIASLNSALKIKDSFQRKLKFSKRK